MDSGATHHLTPDLNNLQHSTPYFGTKQVVIGNGKSLPILNIGSKSLCSPSTSSSVKLKSILHAPHLSHNLINIARLCHDNRAFIEFYSTHFLVKDIQSKTILLRGQLEGGLYKLSLPHFSHNFISS